MTAGNLFLLLHFSGSQVKYKKEYEKSKAQCDYNTLPATENPLLRQLRYAGTILSDVRVAHIAETHIFAIFMKMTF